MPSIEYKSIHQCVAYAIFEDILVYNCSGITLIACGYAMRVVHSARWIYLLSL